MLVRDRVRRLGMLLLLAAALPILARGEQFLGSAPTKPLTPLFPRSNADCDAYDKQWQAVRDAVSRQHDECLKANPGCSIDTAGTGCSCYKCIPYHGSGRLGRDEVDACRAEVRAYLAREREEREQEEREERDRKERARRQESARRDRDREQERDQREADDARARARQDKDERERREQRLLDNLTDHSRMAQEALDRRTAEREDLKDQLQGDRDRATAGLDAEARSRLEASRSIVDLFAGLMPSAAATGTPASQGGIADTFDFSADPGASSIDSLVGVARAVGHPFSSLPFAMVGNAAKASVAAMDRLGHALQHFERADATEVSRILDTYQQRVFSPEAVLGLMAREWVSGAVSRPIESGVRRAVDAGTERIGRAIDTGSYRHLFQEAPVRQYAPTVRQWWSLEPTAESQYRRDSNGVPLLRAPSGELYGFDARAGRATYSAAEAERLVAEGDYLPIVDRLAEWKQHVKVYFVPLRLNDEDALAELLKDYAAATVVGQTWGSIDPTAPTVSAEVRRWVSQLKQWAKEPR